MELHLELNRINICNLVFLSTFQLFLKYFIHFLFFFSTFTVEVLESYSTAVLVAVRPKRFITAAT